MELLRMFVIRPSSGSFLLNLNLTSTVAQTLGPEPSSQEEEEIWIAKARTYANQAITKKESNRNNVRVKNIQFML